ncbi:hypothetical protein Syun_027446 [Stephania yunnanensis]|uniref:Pentatricopeptide repeat-containing protein n=1 Tax=Stephania yunnanensis TaxID=152371 RepID=A0AAP0HR97_9MAGN
MNLIRSYNGFKPLSRSGLFRAFRVSSHSTKTQNSSPPKDDLYRRISPLGDPNISVSPVLDQWIKEGRIVSPTQLRSMIKELRGYTRFTHALEMSQWMSDRKYISLTPADMAIRLDLISKVHGVERAEKYFDTIPKQLRSFQTYGALLNCYAYSKSVDKAEALVQKMKDLGLVIAPLTYNVLLNLYSQVGQHEKIDALMEEMKERGIQMDRFTHSIRLSAYATLSDTEGMERTIKRMEDDPQVTMDWNCYAIAADGYIKAGFIDKALDMLKRSEELITGKKTRVAYEFLITLYASAGQKDEVYRIWNLYKSSEKLYNTAYTSMISSLSKLGDIEGAEKIVEEWETGGTSYDFRVPNCLIAAYCNNGLLEKAESFLSKAIEKGRKPISSSWNRLAACYVKINQMPKAVDAIRKAIEARRPGWKPSHETVSSCVEYLKQEGKVEAVEEFIQLLGESFGSSTTDDL